MQSNLKNHQKIIIRRSLLSDIDLFVVLSKAKRLDYEKAQPQFWRSSGETGDNKQREWFKELLRAEKYLLFTAEDESREIVGFIIGKLITAPEVYNPGGLTLMVDDFCVKSEYLWQLIEAIKTPAKEKGASQILVVCGAQDHSKRTFLAKENLSIASEWFVGGIV